MKTKQEKKIVKVDKMDSFIGRFRENIRLQDELEKKRRNTFFSCIFKKIRI